jgi:dihydroorotate dehydrogenase (fumarate)
VSTLSQNFCGLELGSFAYNGSGVQNTSYDDLKRLAGFKGLEIINTKSATIQPRKGNDEPNLLYTSGYSFNSKGLPNPGFEKTLELVATLNPEVRQYISFSLYGSNLQDTLYMIKEVNTQNIADIIEVNLSCPNIVGKPIIGYDIEMMDTALKEIQKLRKNTPIGVKLPPYLDSFQFENISRLLLKYSIDYIVCCNSVPNCLVVDTLTETSAITPNNGLGGLGGKAIKPIILGNVWSFYNCLQGRVRIVGLGGVGGGSDAFEYLLAGADLVQVATGIHTNGAQSFDIINTELTQIMDEKRYTNIAEVRGKLKV